MEKKEQICTVHWELEGDINKAIDYLCKLKKDYGEPYTKMVLCYEDISDSYDRDSKMGIVLYGVREETEGEATDRELKEKALQKQQEEYQRKTYQALKKKFNP